MFSLEREGVANEFAEVGMMTFSSESLRRALAPAG